MAITVPAVLAIAATAAHLNILGHVAGNEKLLSEMVWPHCWAIEIILFILILVYCTARDLTRVIGREKMVRLFFGPMPLPAF